MHVICSNVPIPLSLDCDVVLAEEPLVTAIHENHSRLAEPKSDPGANDPT